MNDGWTDAALTIAESAQSDTRLTSSAPSAGMDSR